MTTRLPGTALAALLLATSLAGASKPPGTRQVAPFTLEEVGGDSYDAGRHVGQEVMVVAFWATWCKPCKVELAEVANYKHKLGYQFPVLLDSETALLERYNPRGDVPFSMVVDRSGRIVSTHQGFNPGDEKPLEEKLLALLAEGPGGDRAGKELTWAERLGYWVRPDDQPHLELTETLQLRYLHDNRNGTDRDDRVFGIFNYLTVGAATGPFSFGVRADDIFFPGYDPEERCTDDTAHECVWENDHRVERLWLQYKAPSLDIRLGDFYQSIGRGLVFSVRKIDELGLDTSVRGGRAGGKIGPVRVQGFGGQTNIKNLDIVADGLYEEPRDVLAGGEATLDLPYGMVLGARGMWVDYHEEADASRETGDWTVGGSFEARNIAKMLNIYFEGAYVRNLETARAFGKAERDADGYGLYGSVQLTPVEGLALLVEVKDYRRFDMVKPAKSGDPYPAVVYHEPPTLERFDQIVPSNANATGARLLVEYLVQPLGLLVYANAVYYGWTQANRLEEFDRDELPDNFSDHSESAAHAYLGVEKRFQSGLYFNVSGGLRREAPFAPAPGEPEVSRRLWHVESDVQIPLVGRHSIGIRTGHRTEEEALAGAGIKGFVRGDVALTYGFAPHLSVGLLWTYQTEQETEEEYLNLATEVVWRFGGFGQLSLYGGRNTGGIICVSGVCRTMPSFYGVRSELVIRY